MRALQFIRHVCVHTYTLRRVVHQTFMRYWGGVAPSMFPPRDNRQGFAVSFLTGEWCARVGCSSSSMAVRGSAVELEPISDGRSTGTKMQIMQTARHRKPMVVGLHESRHPPGLVASQKTTPPKNHTL